MTPKEQTELKRLNRKIFAGKKVTRKEIDRAFDLARKKRHEAEPARAARD